MDLEQVNCAARLDKPIKKIEELPKGVAQPICSAKLVTTKYGEAVLVELAKHSVFLPKRMIPVLKEHLDKFTGGAYGLVYQEMVGTEKPTPKFEIIEMLMVGLLRALGDEVLLISNPLHNLIRDDLGEREQFILRKTIKKLASYREARAVIAGGYVAFLLGRTNAYGDIDIFVEKDNPALMSYYENVRSYDPQLNIEYNIIEMRTARLLPTMEAFALGVISTFDLEICKAAVFRHKNGFSYCVKFNETAGLPAMPLESARGRARVAKYAQRQNPMRPIQPQNPSLIFYEKLLNSAGVQPVFKNF